MPHIEVFAHLVWSTKYREPLLERRVRQTVFDHIKLNARNKDIHIDTLGGYIDHMHSLVSLSPEMSISKMMQLIKGESSFWINRERLLPKKFEWQDEYYAVSVSPDQLDRVRQYIAEQESHHRMKTFEEEVKLMMKGMGMG
jgi:REP element-mobilizing transposase RayT